MHPPPVGAPPEPPKIGVKCSGICCLLGTGLLAGWVCWSGVVPVGTAENLGFVLLKNTQEGIRPAGGN